MLDYAAHKNLVAYEYCEEIKEDVPWEGTILIRCKGWNCWDELIRPHSPWVQGRHYEGTVVLGRKSRVTLDMMKKGCCPKALMKEFLETERFDAEGGDAAEEAIALSKKGYLGGVG